MIKGCTFHHPFVVSTLVKCISVELTSELFRMKEQHKALICFVSYFGSALHFYRFEFKYCLKFQRLCSQVY